MIPPEHQQAFLTWMKKHEVTDIHTTQWIARMVQAAEEFMREHKLGEDPRAALSWYCRRTARMV